MPFKLFEFPERFTTGAFLITLIHLEKNGSTGKVYSAENLKIKFHFRNKNCSFFLRHFHVRICKVLFRSLSTDVLRLFPEQKKISKTYKRVFTTFVTLNK